MGFVTCGPNEVLVVAGVGHRKPKLVPGGVVFVWPCIQQVSKLNLNTMTIQITSNKVYSIQGVPISVTGIAQVKIQSQHEEMLERACEQFLGKGQNEIKNIAHETMEGHQRAIIGSMTVEEIFQDRKKFSQHVFDVASSDLVNMGITVVSYTLKDVSDDEGYLMALGMARTAEVKRDARIGEAEARMDASVQQAKAEEERMAARFVNDTEIAKAKRDFEVKKAAYDAEVNAKKAEAELAYELQAAKTRQQIQEENMQIKVVERTQAVAVQEQEIVRREQVLEATVRKPAEASKFQLETLAAANRNKVILEAEAEAEAVRVRGEAEAAALKAKAAAEAEQMAKKAEALNEYQEAARVAMMLDALPKITAEVAKPLTQAKKVTMVSSGDGQIGAAKLTGEVLDMVTRMPQLVKQLTGVDISNSAMTYHHSFVVKEVRSMSPYLCAIFLLGLSSLATAANFTLVYEWPDGLDYEWPSEASKTQAWRDGTLKPWEIEPLYMAVYGSRLFFSLESKYPEISVTLVSLPTSGASSAPPKLTPFPSWDMHRIGDCNMIEYATGLQVESVGRLWVLDGGSSHCKSKLWIFDLKKNDHNNLVHQIRNPYPMHDFVLDETAHGTFAYISRWYQQSIVVFSLEKNLFWIVETAEIFVFSIALSPKDQEPSHTSQRKSNCRTGTNRTLECSVISDVNGQPRDLVFRF
ncbi:Hypothetical predicted protein [Cloeon dipterum]|uniref:Band 7 domain-containing protein n=1 Tax=Cloeon dipterum TaxID=197152 RepID=A0A8S1E504_9INSE|nr:Hypothetical predicted protein [Cloeon dipterum]